MFARASLCNTTGLNPLVNFWSPSFSQIFNVQSSSRRQSIKLLSCSFIMRCQPCQNLTLSRLITLAEDEFANQYEFPSSSFYRHHNSIHALRNSARSGCELCSLLLKALPSDDDVRHFNLHTEAVSDIRIAISSSHVPIDTRNTSDVRMFDFLLVRAGERYTDVRCKGLRLHSPAGTAVGRYQIGRGILDSRLSAPSNFAIMRRWLDQCTSKHQVCPDLQRDVLLPKRVIDVGRDGTNFAPFLLVSDGTATGRYAALTHCWGGSIDFVLTNERLEDFQQRLPVERLAQNFKDAVRICRELGVQYLWIDCLCIIQDSADDWTAESSKMASIYSKAFVTISALASHGSSTGIFCNHHARGSDDLGLGPPDKRMKRDLSLGVSVRLDSSSESSGLVYALPAGSLLPLEDLRRLYEVSTLTERAWCLQESLLSPRIIFFGEEQVYWRCFEGFQSADGLPMGNRFDYPDDEEIALAYALQCFSEVAIHTPPHSRSNIYDGGGHHYLISDYSKRNLTKLSDKLPAFSALAERIHANLGDNYLAGLFTANLHSDLLWCRIISPWEDNMEYSESPDYVAPSWSWASTTGEVIFLSQPNSTCRGHTATPRQLRLLDSDIRYQDETNPYGQVLPGSSIIVAGLTARLVLSKQVALGSEWISGERPKRMRVPNLYWDSVSYHHWDSGALDSEGEEVLFAVSSQLNKGETSVQQGRGFYVAMKYTIEPKADDRDIHQPNEGSKEVSILPELFMEDDLLILVVMPEDLDRQLHAECLVLQRTDQDYDIGWHEQQAPVYRRVGYLMLSTSHGAVGWEEMTLKII